MKSNFKNTMLILSGLVILSFTACEKDSDSDPKVDEIVGEWTITSSSYTATINDVDMIQYFMDAFEVSQEIAESITDEFYEDITGTANFKADGTYIMTSNGSTDNGSYKMNADNTKITMDEGTDYEMVMNVSTLTSSKLELSYTETDMEDMDEDGTMDILKMTITLIFSK